MKIKILKGKQQANRDTPQKQEKVNKERRSENRKYQKKKKKTLRK